MNHLNHLNPMNLLNHRNQPNHTNHSSRLNILSRILCAVLAITLLMTTAGLTPWAGAEEARSLYSEKTMKLPQGWKMPTAIAASLTGELAALSQGPDGLTLLTYRDESAEPAIMPIRLQSELGENEFVSYLGIAPDGMMALYINAGFNLSSTPRRSGGGQGGQNNNPNTPGGQAGGQQGGQAGGQPEGGAYTVDDIQRAASNIMTGTVVWLDETGVEKARFSRNGGMQSANAALSGMRLAVSGNRGGAAILDASGAEIANLEARYANGIASDADNIYVLEQRAVSVFNATTYAKSESIDVSGLNLNAIAAFGGKVYGISIDGARELSGSGNALVMAAAGTYLGDPSVNMAGFIALADGRFAGLTGNGSNIVTRVVGGMNIGATASLFGGGQSESYLLYYSPLNITSSNRSGLKITALSDSQRLRKAVNEFQRLRPDVNVTLDIRMGENDASPIDDHIRALNTDLLAGKGGDVLIMDGLPINSYINRGILLDISQLIPSLGILPGIAEGSRFSDGKTYMVPAQFTFPTLWGKASVINQIGSLRDVLYISLPNGQQPMMSRSANDWLELLYPSIAPIITNKNGSMNFESPEFIEFLEIIGTLRETPEAARPFDLPGGRFAGNAVRRAGLNMQEMLDLFSGAIAIQPLTISTFMQLSPTYSLAGAEECGFMPMPSLNGDGLTYTPALLAGVNSRSGNQAMAIEFIRTLFSDDVQGMAGMGGLPTKESAVAAMVEEQAELSETADVLLSMMIPGAGTITLKRPTRDVWNQLFEMCRRVNTPTTIDRTLMGFIVEGTAAFFEGKGDAKQAARDVMQRAFYYMNE